MNIDFELFTAEEWINNIEMGIFNEYDGIGYWSIGESQLDVDSFEPKPDEATHVIWHAK